MTEKLFYERVTQMQKLLSDYDSMIYDYTCIQSQLRERFLKVSGHVDYIFRYEEVKVTKNVTKND